MATELLAERIESLRLQRISHASTKIQNTLAKPEISVDHTLFSIAEILKEELRAKYFSFENSNTSFFSASFPPLRTKVQLVENPRETQSFDPRHIPTVEEIDREIKNTLNSSDEIAEFRLAQDSYILQNRPITVANDLTKSLHKSKTHDLIFKIGGKKSNGYLQECFSDTDRLVVDQILGYIEPFSAAKIFEENYQIIHATLRKLRFDGSTTVHEIHDLCQRLSHAFINTSEVLINYGDQNVEITCESHNTDNSPSAEYLERLKDRYLAKWNPEPMQTLVMRAGIEKADDHSILEFHLPGDGNKERLFLLTYNRQTITESILRSCVIFFNELHNRIKKLEQQSDTISYPTQVRHAVIHHFSAAAEGMASIKPMWDRGRKSKPYWDELFSNAVLTDQVNRSIWSLGQARLLIDNGRFLLGELDRLNRKNYQLRAIIDDCLRTLNSQRASKAIVIKAVTRGTAPSVMNADEPILKVALMNLVDNAFKYSQVGGLVRWEVDYGPEGYLFRITSSGTPIDPVQFKRLLAPGVRGRQLDHLNQRHGTGLGLPVANRILLAHSPQAPLQIESFESAEGFPAGTNCFFFYMPYLTGQSHRDDQ